VRHQIGNTSARLQHQSESAANKIKNMNELCSREESIVEDYSRKRPCYRPDLRSLAPRKPAKYLLRTELKTNTFHKIKAKLSAMEEGKDTMPWRTS